MNTVKVSGGAATRRLAAALACVILAACGGGGGESEGASGGAPAAPAAGTPGPSAGEAADLAIAERLYRGTDRTPAGFFVEPRPSSVAGPIATVHLKSRDLQGPAVAQYELCTDDLAEAIAWSETMGSWQGQPSDMMETRSDARAFEISRVPRGDLTALLRHRVFRCSYLDRAGSDLALDQGAAGVLKPRPLDASLLEDLVEYLWQFTVWNNSGHLVVSSEGSGAAAPLQHRVRMARLLRGAAGACDTVEIFDWTHTLDSGSGALTRSLATVRSFRTRDAAGNAQLCTG